MHLFSFKEKKGNPNMKLIDLLIGLPTFLMDYEVYLNHNGIKAVNMKQKLSHILQMYIGYYR